MPSRLSLTRPAGTKIPAYMFEDHDWFREHEIEILEKYGEGFCVVYKKQVLGAGPDYDVAIAEAERNLPPGDEIVVPLIEGLKAHYPYMHLARRIDPSERST